MFRTYHNHQFCVLIIIDKYLYTFYLDVYWTTAMGVAVVRFAV